MPARFSGTAASFQGAVTVGEDVLLMVRVHVESEIRKATKDGVVSTPVFKVLEGHVVDPETATATGDGSIRIPSIRIPGSDQPSAGQPTPPDEPPVLDAIDGIGLQEETPYALFDEDESDEDEDFPEEYPPRGPGPGDEPPPGPVGLQERPYGGLDTEDDSRESIGIPQGRVIGAIRTKDRRLAKFLNED